MATAETITAMLTIFGSVWRRQVEEMGPLAPEIYHRILVDLPDDLVQAATANLVAEKTFLPVPAEVRRAAIALRWPDELTGVEAWGRLGAWIRRWPAGGRWVGDHHVDPPRLPKRVQRAVDAIGGLSYLRYSEDAVADRARFVQAYDALLEREQREARMLPEVRAVARAQLEAAK